MELQEIRAENQRETAVKVQNAHKKYGTKTIVMDQLNMTVPVGTIYGLLGPSGCGKTTLLRCILGRIQLDFGEITVKVKSLANVGYMPQEINLYNELSILETMIFYGRIFGLDYNDIEQRTEEWLEFLELPSKSRIIQQLSGGQQRRVSFAVALLHNPQLLILDEPTVGVDSLLNERIWDKFVHMAENENKTVIITTHYIEESRRAHTIGLMRNGKMIVEEAPSQLMTRYNTSNLEDIFLQLSQRQQHDTSFDEARRESRRFDDVIIDNIAAHFSLKHKSQIPLQQNLKCSKDVVFALMTKTCCWMRRNKSVATIVLLLPILASILINMGLGNDSTGLKIAVVNDELPIISNCKMIPSRGCNFSVPLSCRFLNKFPRKMFTLVTYYNLKSGINAVKKNHAWALLYFAKNYTASLYKRLNLGRKASNESLAFSEAQIWMDMSNLPIQFELNKHFIESCTKFLEELLSDCSWPPRAVKMPIKLEKAVYGDFKLSFRQGSSATAVTMSIFFLTMAFTFEAMSMERKTGSMDRTLISGVTILEILTAHTIIQFFTITVQGVAIMILQYVVFDNPIIIANIFPMILLIYLVSNNTMFFSILLAMITDSEQLSIYLAIGFALTVFFTLGMMWPVDGMHWSVRHFAQMSPFTQGGKSLRALAINNNAVTDPIVYNGYLSNIGWSCVLVLITWLIIKQREGFRMK